MTAKALHPRIPLNGTVNPNNDERCPMCGSELYRVIVEKECIGKCYRYYCKKCNYENDRVAI